jgi:hypothetical protein
MILNSRIVLRHGSLCLSYKPATKESTVILIQVSERVGGLPPSFPTAEHARVYDGRVDLLKRKGERFSNRELE